MAVTQATRAQFGRGKLLYHRGWRDYAYAREGTSQQDIHWRAILVETARVDGKPKQRHIAYLAGFTDSAVAIPQQQRYLWGRIHERLDRLGNQLSPADRRHIEALLIKKIGKPPTKAQRAKLDRQRERTLRNLLDHFRQG